MNIISKTIKELPAEHSGGQKSKEIQERACSTNTVLPMPGEVYPECVQGQ